ncbi:MAG TPA: leucyl/phenylalanyl-tRNA--protein transferase [Flavipsychrobacter sp.]|nr:leucyl/phenylalanyl-tRNA--protein transferase [Flavipsychrobacter sp.]
MLQVLTDTLIFPPVNLALEDGLLAIGGDLSMERLLLAYRSGIFPWFNEDELPMWWCPDPRFVLFPDELRESKSMKQFARNSSLDFRIDTAFEEVIRSCQAVKRQGQDGTWITREIMHSYTALHNAGYAHSAEAWRDGKLVGGLYGIRLGRIFFGESMFSTAANASKFAFIHYVKQLQREGVVLIDCQVYTQHLESLGARMISRDHFIRLLKSNLSED